MKYFFFLILKKFILYGKLDIEIGNDPVKSIVGQLDGPNIHIQILNLKHLFLIVRSPELSFGELYMNKELKIKKGNLEDLMKFLMLNYNSWQSTNFGKIRKYLNDLKNFFSTFNPIKKAKRNAAHHYDLNDDLFESFLDKRRQYSCGFFYSKNESLEDAQINKVSRLVAKLQINKVLSILKKKFITQGKEVEKFEKSLSKKFKCKYCLVVSSGTAALHLAGKSLGWKKNDIVVCTPITFVASCNSIIYNEAKPYFVDISLKNNNLDIDKLQESLKDFSRKKKELKPLW